MTARCSQVVEEPAPGALALRVGETDCVGVLSGSTQDVTGPERGTTHVQQARCPLKEVAAELGELRGDEVLRRG